MSEVKKAVFAYSGGLDASVILKCLQDTHRCEVVTFTADLGQGEELESKSDSLFDSTIASFEDDAGAYDQKDAAGFIKLNALRLRIAAKLAKRRK